MIAFWNTPSPSTPTTNTRRRLGVNPPAHPVISVGADKPYVCLLGNAQSVQLAWDISKQWTGLPAIWAVWGQDATAMHADLDHLRKTTPEANAEPTVFNIMDPAGTPVFTTFVCNRDACPWVEGLRLALQYAREHGYPCDYYFTVDDDSQWQVVPELAKDLPLAQPPANADPAILDRLRPTAVTTELLDVLHHWRPAVAAFNWDYADTSFDGARKCLEAFGHERVAPLSAYDNGNALYHSSIIDFIIPFAPRGEGGYTGNWTLPASWLNMIVPLTFRSNALRINSIRYTNTINMNNAKSDSEPAVTRVEGSLFFTSAARHPYEFPIRKKYEAFLESGLKVMSWGMHLRPADIDWRPEVGHPPFHDGISTRVDSFYDVTHPGIQRNMFNVVDRASFTFKIVVAAKFGPEFLLRALRSLNGALYGSAHSASLHVRLMYKDPAMASKATALLDAFEWIHGPKTVQRGDLKASLVDSLQSAWYPVRSSEHALVIDDSVEVSEYFFLWVRGCVQDHPRYSQGADPRRPDPAFLGCSLTPASYSYVSGSHMPVESGHLPVMLQEASSPAIVFPAHAWREFLDWLAKNDAGFVLKVPSSRTNLWPEALRWRQMLTRFAVETGKFVVAPNLPYKLALAQWTVPCVGALDILDVDATSVLLSRSMAASTPDLQPAMFRADKATVLLDLWREPTIASLLPVPLEPFDKLTIVMPGFSRRDILVETVRWYCDIPFLAEIVVVWNNPDMDPPDLSDVPCPSRVIREATNSLHNRFKPIRDIRSWAVMSVDDDVRVEVDGVIDAFNTWQQFPERHVGFLFTARGAVMDAEAGEWEYRNSFIQDILLVRPPHCSAPWRPNDMNFVLTGGSIFHNKFLGHYTFTTDPFMTRAKSLVSSVFNGEDILFSFMHARLTGLGPMLVSGRWNQKLMAGAPGLYKRPSHFNDRAAVITKLVDILGDMPLLPATGFFWHEGHPHVVDCTTKLPVERKRDYLKPKAKKKSKA